MKQAEVVMEGTVTDDGRVVVEGKPDLPPGRVRITLETVEDAAPAEHPMFATFRQIWADLDARGFRGRTAAEAVADVRALRDEWDVRQEAVERLQDRLRARRETPARQGGRG